MDQSNEANKSSCKHSFVGVIWWAYLITAVLAVPSMSFLITKLVPAHGMVELMVFIIACWFCTFVGMRLMSNPKLAPPKKED